MDRARLEPTTNNRTLDHDSTQLSLQGFEGRVALVTGAAGGIGRRVVETFLALGAGVAALDLAKPNIPGAVGITMDVTDPESVAAGTVLAEAELGPASILVTSAGIFNPAQFAEIDLELWRRTLDVNVTGTFNCVREVLPAMCDRGYGRIVTISSVAGIDGGHWACAHYATSKGAVNTFTKAISREHCARGVTANVVAPRNIRTPMVAGLEAQLAAQTPVGRLGEPDDVAAVVAFLSSAHASYITGEIVVLNGGWW
jgi:NAD(P)-dependent dehydrogenase (short-subunit alcohol dehydrogenase family)